MDDDKIQQHFNKLRSELLDKQEKKLDRWLNVIGISLTGLCAVFAIFAIFIAIYGFFTYDTFRTIEIKAEASANKAAKHAQEAQGAYEETKGYRDKAAEYEYGESEPSTKKPEDVARESEPSTKKPEDTYAVNGDEALADSLQEQGKISEARGIWRSIAHSAEERSDNDRAAEAWYKVGYLYRNEDPEACILANTKAIDLKPNYAEAYRNRGAAKGMLGLYKSAILDLSKAIDLKPDLLGAYHNRGNANHALGEYDAAIRDYSKVISLDSDYAAAYFGRGTARNTFDQIDEARQDFRKARDLARSAGNNSLADSAEKRLRDLESRR